MAAAPALGATAGPPHHTAMPDEGPACMDLSLWKPSCVSWKVRIKGRCEKNTAVELCIGKTATELVGQKPAETEDSTLGYSASISFFLMAPDSVDEALGWGLENAPGRPTAGLQSQECAAT